MNLPNKTILEVDNLTVCYAGKEVVKNFSLNLSNETIVLFGPSGCGKSTILKALLGTKISGMTKKGNIKLLGKEIIVGSGEVGIVLQGPVIPGWITVEKLFYLATKSSSIQQKNLETDIDTILLKFGILELKHQYPHQLSGGQRQRVSLAITLIKKPKLLLLDEPTTFIDGATRLDIWDYIEKHIRPLDIPTIIVSHDPVESIRLGDRILKLSYLAQVVDTVLVSFPHPRSELIEKSDEYWDYRKKINSYDYLHLKN